MGEFKEKSLEVKEVSFEKFDKNGRTYQCILSFLNGEKARLFCKENDQTKVMNPIFVAIMDGSCPCCKKPTCLSFESKKEMLFNEVLRLNPKAKAFDAGNLLMVLSD